MTQQRISLLLTGAHGAIGSTFRARWSAQYAGPTVAVVQPGIGEQLLPGDVAVDLAIPGALADLVVSLRPQVIVHLAAITGSACEADRELAEAVNVRAVKTLAQAAANVGTSRIVFASTAGVYGDQRQRRVKETEDPEPPSFYGQTKLEAEYALASALESSETTQAIALRIFNVFGPAFPSSLVSRLAESTPNHPVTVNGLDRFVRDYVHVEDVAAALYLSTTTELSGTMTTVNIGRGIPISNRELISALERVQPVHVIVGDERSSYSCADTTLAHETLGFSATRGLTD